VKIYTILFGMLVVTALCGCKKDHKSPATKKPPASDIQKVPDAPSNLQLSAIAAVAMVAYAVSARKERVS
jgi:hypothetical protein